ncbi:hypothetical protein BS50DRAFT_635564 [Corynespora cassiicola Philippines]|uniref:Uncharacterized protein n=1 Tax=Corynespora cassiicola Philippines TaxID=1448308 RepID=A0A2T2NN13_CORCC|nr:hypothetical protein BS50DRAFT_635564 [Corynespora cassiicola Philippines]
MDPRELVSETYHVCITVRGGDTSNWLITVKAEDSLSRPTTSRHGGIGGLIERFKNHWERVPRNTSKYNQRTPYPYYLRPKLKPQLQRSQERGWREDAKGIQAAAQHAGERVLGKREAFTMAEIADFARGIVGKEMIENRSINVFHVYSTRDGNGYTATLWGEGDDPEHPFLLATGYGADHKEALVALDRSYMERARRENEAALASRF